LQSFGLKRTIEQCNEMIRSAAKSPHSTGLNQREFADMMLPFMLGELSGQEENTEELRAKFLEADVDGSGFLSVEELWNAVRGMGADVQLEDIVELMSELDVDRDGQLDVDEFLSLLRLGGQLQFRGAGVKSTYSRINSAAARGTSQLSPIDFLKSFKDMPTNFTPSFVQERWASSRNLPSSAFRAQVDPETMLFKDVLAVESSDYP